jgi:8-amino-7-oxononanoate synthase
LEGGYVAGSTTLIEYIKDNSTVLQFSNRITRPNARAITSVLENTGPRVECAETLLKRSRELVERLGDLRYEVVYFDYPVIGVVLGDMMLALLVQKRCRDQGLSVSVMVPPLVPENLSGIRLSLHGGLARSDVERVGNVFKDIKRHTEQASV